MSKKRRYHKKIIILFIILLASIAISILFIINKPKASVFAPTTKTVSPLIPYRVKSKWGYSDRKGRLVIQPKYDEAFPFHDGFAKVGYRKGDTLYSIGFISEKGQEVIPFGKFYSITDDLMYDREELNFNNGKAIVQIKNGELFDYVLIDKNGSVLLLLKREESAPPFNFPAFRALDSGTKYYDSNAEGFEKTTYGIVPAKKLEPVFPYPDGQGKRRMRYYNTYGEVGTRSFEQGSLVKDGMGRVFEQGRYGYIDINGNVTIDFQYPIAQDFSEGLAMVGSVSMSDYFKNLLVIEGGHLPFLYGIGDNAPHPETRYKIGYIDKQNTLVIPMKYCNLGGKFYDGVARVQTHCKYDKNLDYKGVDGYINTQGFEYWKD